MISTVLRQALLFRFLVLTLAGVLILVGIVRLRDMPIDVLPEYAPPYVEVQTEALGLSANEVESLVTLNLEELLQGVPWLQAMRSQSVPGLSSVVLVFEPGTDISRARQVVQERLTLAHMLPNVSSPPIVLQPLSATSRVMVLSLSSKQLTPIQLSVLARWKIKPALTGVPGVANVSIWGQRERQLQVRVDPELMRAHGITLDQVVRTTGDALWVSPLSFLFASTPGTGGWIDTPQQRLEVRHVLPIVSAQDLARIPIYGSSLTLADVAEVVEDHQPLIGEAVREGDQGLLMVIEKFPGANTVVVTRAIESTLRSMQPGLAGVDIDTTILRPATFIELALANLGAALLVALAAIALVLFALFLRLRVAVISVVAILLSLTAAAVVLHLRGETLNAMTFAGILIALVVLIDDAVVDPENISRRLRRSEGETADPRLSLTLPVIAAAAEVRRPLIFATAIAAVLVVPVFFFRGVSGALVQPIAISYLLAIAASFVCALTVTPALSLILLPESAVNKRRAPFAWIQGGYRRLLQRTLPARAAAVAIIGALLLAGVASIEFVGMRSLIPEFRERQMLIQWDGAPGTSHPEMTRITTEATRELRTVPGVSNAAAHVGRAVLGDEVVGINSAKIWVTIAATADYDATVGGIRRVVDRYPGLVPQLHGYIETSVREALAGSSRDMVVRVFGPEWAGLRTTASTVRDSLARIPGVVDLTSEQHVEEPTVEVEVDLAKAQRYGVKPGDVRRAASTLVNGLPVGLLFEQQKIFDVVVWSKPESRDSLTDIRELLIDTPGGTRVRLEDVADIRVVPALNTISREAVSRRIDVSFNVRGRNIGDVAHDVQTALLVQRFPLEYHAELLGEYAERQADVMRILVATAVAIVGVFLLLQAAFQSWRLAALAFLALPCAIAGGLVAAALTGGDLSIGSLAGLVAVIALAARQGVLLLSRFQTLDAAEDAASSYTQTLAVAGGAVDRVGPVLATVLATGLALTAISVFGTLAGHAIWLDMAIVVAGGLVASTVVSLVVLPTLYLQLTAPSRLTATRQRGPASAEAAAD